MITEIVTIPEFTADDYLTGVAPYEFLYKYKDKQFLLKQLLGRMKAQASSLGVRSFVGMWNAYLQEKSAGEGIKINNATAFENQPLELFSGRYTCDDYGVTTSGFMGEIVVCSHPIMPVKRLINIDTGEERLELAYRKGRMWRSIIVEKSTIASSSAILQLAAFGVMVNAENAKALSTYLMAMEELNYDAIPEEKSVGRLGWVNQHGFSPYVDGLTFDGEANFRHIFAAVRTGGNFDAWKNIMLKLRAERGVGRLFLAASFASVILEPCGLLPFFLHAWGGTETGKTVGLKIAASVWASPGIGEFIMTFNSTTVGQEMTAGFLNSLPMCMDELQIQSSAGIRDFDRMIYQLTEGTGRTRGAKLGGLQRQATWRNCIITNGEHPISTANSGGGAVNRIIEFECEDKVYSDLVALCAVVDKNYGWAGRAFVEYLQKPGVLDLINEVQKNYYTALLKMDSTEKQAASASAILAADAVATELFFKDGNELTIEEISKVLAKRDEVNVNSRALQYLYQLIAANPNHFSPDLNGEYRAEVWGKAMPDRVYIIKSIFDREMQNGGFNGTAFLSWAKRIDRIVTDNNRRTKNARIGNSVVQTICLKLEIPTGFEPFDGEI